MEEELQPVEQTEEVAEEPQTEPVEEEIAEEPEQPETETEEQLYADGVDEMGVPWKNRYMEAKRKLEKAEQQPQQQPAQQPSYTVEQLEKFAQATSDPSSENYNESHASWAKNEIKSLQTTETKNLVQKEFNSLLHKQQFDTTMKKSLEYVQQAYPQMFSKDSYGRINGWNDADPFKQQVTQIYFNTPELRQNPKGLAAAADIVYAQVAKHSLVQTKEVAAAKEQELKAQMRKYQKNSMVEGGGVRNMVGKSDHRKNMDKFMRTGSIKDASKIMQNIFKEKGVLDE